MIKKKSLIYLVVTISLLLLFYLLPSYLLLYLMGIGLAFLAAILWGTGGGAVVLFLLSAVALSIFFKSLEILLFGISATVITIAITFRLKTTIQRLRRSEKQYQSIVNNISGAVYTRKTDGTIVFLSERFAEISGHLNKLFFSGEKKLSDIIHPEDWSRVRQEIDKRANNGEAWDIEYKIITNGDKIKWVNERGRMILSVDETSSLIEGVIFEITDRKIIEQALRDSEEKYRNLVERANDGIVIMQEGKVKYLNQRMAEMLEYKSDEVIETLFEKYLVGREKEKFIEIYKKTEEGKSPLVYEMILNSKNGKNVYSEMNLGFINYNGKLASLVIIRDISQRKQIEEIINQREQELRNLVERSPDIIARFDSEFRYLYINPAIEIETGILPRDFFWKTIREVGTDNETTEMWERALESVFFTAKERAIYTEHSTAKGKKYYYTRLLPEFDKEGTIRTVLAISRDITEVKKIDNVKSEFISLSSHQLRTPLSAIRWCTVMFLDGMLGKISQEQRDYLGKIYQATKKLIKISNAFFNVATLDLGILSVLPRKVNLIDIIKESIKDLESERSEREVKISENYESDLPPIKADERILMTIFRGLLSNAIKYGYQGGNVWLNVKKREKDILIKISDDGLGIPEEDQAKIFTKFFRASNIKDKEIYGSGLDLYIIKEIVTVLEGKIWFESPNPDFGEFHRGTSFYFTIPLIGMKKSGKKELVN